jgi:hypothetical protein
MTLAIPTLLLPFYYTLFLDSDHTFTHVAAPTHMTRPLRPLGLSDPADVRSSGRPVVWSSGPLWAWWSTFAVS